MVESVAIAQPDSQTGKIAIRDPSADTIERQVYRARIETLFAHSPQILIANAVNAALVGVLIWSETSWPIVIAFWVAMAGMVACRVFMGRAYRRRSTPYDVERWAWRFTLASGVSGLLWGLGTAALFQPDDIATQVLLAFVIGGMGAGASSTIASHPPAFRVFLIPSVLPLTLRFAWEGDPVHWVMASMGLLFGVLFLRIGKTTHATLVESYRLRFSNEQLVEQLCDMRVELEDANLTLEERVEEQTEARAQAEHKLQQTQKLEAVGRLTGGVAHDFNNHLTVIVQCLELLGEPDLEHGESTALINSATTAARRGADLTRKLLAFSRRQPLAPVLLDVGATLDASVESMIRRVMPENIRLHFDDQAQGAYARVDLTQLEAAVLNLAINARDAMPDGGNLWIAVEREDEAIKVSVADDGTGIDPDVIDQVLEPFFTTKGAKGTGLGLSMVHGFAAQSGGSLHIDARPEGGTIVSIWLPAAVAPPPSQVAATESPNRPHEDTTVEPGNGERILLVEDNPTVREATRRTLESLGYEVTTAPDVGVALTELDGRTVDLLVSDVMMPGGRGGLDLAEEAERRWPDLPILLITGHADDLERLIRYPVVHKPYERSELSRQLRSLLN